VDATGPDVVGVVADVLTENGPLTEAQLVAVLVSRGVVLGEDPGEALDEALEQGDGLAVSLADGRWAWLPALLAGRVFTHRLSADEVTHDLLVMCPDLDPLSMLLECEDYQHLVDAAPIEVVLEAFDADVLDERGVPARVLDENGGLLLPAGYLSAAGVGAGDVIGISLSADGLRVTAGIELGDRVEDLAGLEHRLSMVLADRAGEPVELDVAVWTACAEAPELFTAPLPPLAEILDGFGLCWQGDWLAAAGFDFDRWWARNRVHALAERHDLDEDEALAVAATVRLYEQIAELHAAAQAAFDAGGQPELSALLGAEHDAQADNDTRKDTALVGEPGATPPQGLVSERERAGESGPDESDEPAGMRVTVAATMVLLAEPAVAEAVLAETLGSGHEGAAALGLFAETCEPLAPRPARVALRWLRAKAHERLGGLSQAEQAYSDAQTLDPDWPPVLWDLARYASDRGDATRGLSLLRRAGAPAEDELVELLEQHQPRPRSDTGRNQRCWCGSGRKYKQCHLGREALVLGERAGWLYQKAGMFLHDGPWWDTVVAAAIERARYTEGPDAFRVAVSDPLVADAVLFEGGVFAEFLDTRGQLLPDDERLLGQQWLLVERSVHEVEHVERGRGLTLRDVRTGDIAQVRERSASTQLRVGELVCARVVPAGDTMQIFGGIEPVGLAQRDELIALLDSGPDPVDLVEFLTRRFAPPTLCNTEGDPLVLCEASLRSANPIAMAHALDDIYDRADETEDSDHDAENADPATDDTDPDQLVRRWFEHVTTDAVVRLRATVELAGARVRIHTNSEARLERVLTVLRGVDPAIDLVEQTRRPARDAREMMQLAARFPDAGSAGRPKPVDPTDPHVAAALRQFSLDYEHRWLDEPIPALAGCTPRQAAADPTRRADLTRLLDTFPADPANPGLMDPDRLRAELGL
jgi:tetratricopeptide (TPR) repeat protein